MHKVTHVISIKKINTYLNARISELTADLEQGIYSSEPTDRIIGRIREVREMLDFVKNHNIPVSADEINSKTF